MRKRSSEKRGRIANMVWAFRETDHAAPNFFVEVKKNRERFVQASDLKGIRIIHTAWAGGFNEARSLEFSTSTGLHVKKVLERLASGLDDSMHFWPSLLSFSASTCCWRHRTGCCLR